MLQHISYVTIENDVQFLGVSRIKRLTWDGMQDCPGHERLSTSLFRGSATFYVVMLVVAANEPFP